MPDHYQTKVEKTNADAMKMALKMTHRIKDYKKYSSPILVMIRCTSKPWVDLLEDLGMPDGSIVCTSVPGHGIPGGAKIYY